MVPSVEPGLVRFSSDSMVGAFRATLSGWSETFASPKSRIFACPLFVTKMFAGLMSRWMISLRVCGIESIADLDAQVEYHFDLQGLTVNTVPKRLPLQQFHGNERSRIDLIDFIDRADVWMIQGRGGTSFTTKTVQCLRVSRKIIR